MTKPNKLPLSTPHPIKFRHPGWTYPTFWSLKRYVLKEVISGLKSTLFKAQMIFVGISRLR
jgi:hypothetical protein